jgi:hypothetical protein
MSNLTTLLREFREGAAQLAEYAGFDQTKKYVRTSVRVGALFSEIRKHGDLGLDGVQHFLVDTNPWVRFSAASCLLDHRTEAAIKTLDIMAQERGGVVNSQSFIHLFTWYYDRTGKYYEPGESLEF